MRKQRPVDPAVTQATRRKNAELRATRVVTDDVPHKVRAADCTCPKCDGTDLRPVGDGKISTVLDYVSGYFRRRQHIRETLACSCGDYIVTAPGPDHSVEGARYGDSFRAFVVTSKCADAIPLYRQAKQMSRLGIPISRSTLTDLLHQAARQLGRCRSGYSTWSPLPRSCRRTRRRSGPAPIPPLVSTISCPTSGALPADRGPVLTLQQYLGPARRSRHRRSDGYASPSRASGPCSSPPPRSTSDETNVP